MDQKPQIPEIRAEVNKEPEKKKAGLLAGLFGGGGSGAGAGGAGGIGGAAAGGGLLAGKAGVLALIMAGTTVAGGIGMVGYKIFGPGEADRAGGGEESYAVFAPKPKEAAPASAAAPDAMASKSIDGFAKANSGATKDATAAAAEAPKAAAAAAGPSASASASTHPMDVIPGGNSAFKPIPKAEKKFGELSKNFGGGNSSASTGGGAKSAADAAALAASAKAGKLGAMSKSSGSGASALGSRSVASARNRRKAIGDARLVLGDNKKATTSYGGGRTYDNGTAKTGGTGIGTGNSTSLGSPGGLGTGQTTTPPPSKSLDKNEQEPPAEPETSDITPYAGIMNQAKILLLLGAGLLTLARAMKGYPTAAKVLAGFAAIIGLYVVALGARIANADDHPQKMQGMILGAAGLGLVAAGSIAIWGEGGPMNDLVMTLAGASALISMVGTSMSTPVHCKSTDGEHCNAMYAPAAETSKVRYLT